MADIRTSPATNKRISSVSSASSSLSLSFNIGDTPRPRTCSISSSSSQDTMSSRATDDTSLSSLQEENAYFSSNPPPKALPQHLAAAQAFITQHASENRRVVLITSGGTTVPLEKQTVRFIDNFSAGTRGATSAEYFLESGYAVIFLHRQFSLLPYSRHYSHSTDCFLDFMSEDANGNVVVNPLHQSKMQRVLKKYSSARDQNMLLMLPFVTITDYLHELREITRLMRPLGPNGLLYMAAAVSDFFVPPERMSEHKIQSTDAVKGLKQSGQTPAAPQQETTHQGPTTITTEKRPGGGGGGGGGDAGEEFDNFDSSPAVPRSKRLIVDLDPVPKFLKNLVDGWAPEGMIVSFKLETDPEILVHKAKYSLARYQHHLVIGNLLTTRKWEVVFVSPGREDNWIRVPVQRRKKTATGIESLVGASERKDSVAAVGGLEGEEEEEELLAMEKRNKPMDPASLPDGEPEIEIESLIIPAVKELHDRHVEQAARS